MRTYLYKLTSDRGGAPCAPPPLAGTGPLLTLSICKPAIRRTAQAGDRLLGLTSVALAQRENYPPVAVIYAAKVTETLDLGEYYEPAGPHTQRPDCIYAFHPETGELHHTGRTRLHTEPGYAARDVGRAPHFRNARTLLSTDFRYFGAAAMPIPAHFALLSHVAQTLGQGHRVFTGQDPESRELDRLFTLLWKQPTRFTPAIVQEEAHGHAPRRKAVAI